MSGCPSVTQGTCTACSVVAALRQRGLAPNVIACSVLDGACARSNEAQKDLKVFADIQRKHMQARCSDAFAALLKS